MTILYHGRKMLCHRARTGGECHRNAEFRVETENAFLHLCGHCAEPFNALKEWRLIPLAPDGEPDELPATSLDDDSLLVDSPWIISINGRTRNDALRDRGMRA